MDDLISKLMPQAKCVEDPIVPDLAEDPMTGAVAEQEEMMGGGTGDFKSAMEFRGIGHRRALFSTEMDKIDGFKLSFSMPVSPSFMMQHKWMLYPPQNSNPNPMMDMMMPPKSSHYEMDVYYIHGMPDSEPMSGPMDIDISKMTHFRGSRKASGAVEAMIMKVLSKNIDFRFEGFFRNVGQGQWNATINHKSKVSLIKAN